MLPNDEPTDGLMHELINVVRDNTEKTIAVRTDVNRAMSMIYQRIIAIESQNMIEARERPERQKQLDRTLAKINGRLDGQDTTLEGQDQKLDTLFDQQENVIRSGRWRMRLMIGILMVCSFIALRVALVCL